MGAKTEKPAFARLVQAIQQVAVTPIRMSRLSRNIA